MISAAVGVVIALFPVGVPSTIPSMISAVVRVCAPFSVLITLVLVNCPKGGFCSSKIVAMIDYL